VDEYLNNRKNEILWNLLADPVNTGHSYTSTLQDLVAEFPQSGLLHAFLSHASGGQNTNHAAAYLNPRTLYILVNAPENLPILTDSQIIQQLSDTIDYVRTEKTDQVQQVEEEPEQHDLIATNEEEHHLNTEPETVFDEIGYAPLIAEDANEHLHMEDNEPHLTDTEQAEEEVIDAGHTHYQEAVVESPEEISGPEITAENIRQEELVTETSSFELTEPPRGIDDDIYDEIVGIDDISFARVDKPADEVPPQEETPVIDEEATPGSANHTSVTEPAMQRERVLNMDDEAEKLIVGNIAATDYFVFDRAFNERKQAETIEGNSFVEENRSAGVEVAVADENNEVSKYNDDTLPYTFLWWLNKTRREHAGIYQPFKLDTSQAIRQAGADELQQQYYENIFHLSSVEELDRSTSQKPIEFDLKSKEDRIIKRFIVEEPHISTPSSDKLDTENKARKSSEDQDELVTETLAHIYIDQMLYHKAINTYKKLMLKFPEKSRYFADQIEQLEKKTN
jgi:hypothetical protein